MRRSKQMYANRSRSMAAQRQRQELDPQRMAALRARVADLEAHAVAHVHGGVTLGADDTEVSTTEVGE